MHNQSITLKLELPEFAVQGTVTDQNGDLLVIVTAKSLPVCPDCGGNEVALHDRRKQWIEDQPVRDKRVFLLCEKRRFRCIRCDVLFSETYPSLSRYGRCTKRMAEWWFELCRNRSIAQVATEIGWTRPRVDRLFHRIAAVKIEQRYQEVPEIIGIDEFAVLRHHIQAMLYSDIPEYKTLAKTMLAWRSEILAYFLYSYTNGFTEGTNTKIKLLKRIGYGIPSFQKLRNRILSYK